MTRYAVIENDMCINVIEADEIFALKYEKETGYLLLPAPDGYGIGDSCICGEWIKAPVEQNQDVPAGENHAGVELDALRAELARLSQELELLSGTT